MLRILLGVWLRIVARAELLYFGMLFLLKPCSLINWRDLFSLFYFGG